MKSMRIHLVGVCGVAMGTLAAMLREQGHVVSGSDAGVYPPMSTMLEKWGVTLHEGYDPALLDRVNLTIVGNAISRGNPQVERVLDERLPYCSMPAALHRFFLAEREVIAVCGTHGKTTTTACLAHILVAAGLDPSFLVGGVSVNYDSNYRLGAGRYFVIEGDEYDSAFFEKTPKFMAYRPYHAIFTSLEFDHADIYKNLEEIQLWFSRLVRVLPQRGHLVYSGHYESIPPVLAEARCTLCRVPDTANSGWSVVGRDESFTTLDVLLDNEPCRMRTTLFGDFNFDNITMAATMAFRLGVAPRDIAAAIETFRGVKRRQEFRRDEAKLKVMEDFAHHPTAIDGMLRAARERFAGFRLVALYEPRSATGRRNTFQYELPGALALADEVLIKQLYRPEAIAADQRLDVDVVVRDIVERGVPAAAYGSVGDMAIRAMEIAQQEPTVIVVMSNGGFDGIYELLI